MCTRHKSPSHHARLFIGEMSTDTSYTCAARQTGTPTHCAFIFTSASFTRKQLIELAISAYKHHWLTQLDKTSEFGATDEDHFSCAGFSVVPELRFPDGIVLEGLPRIPNRLSISSMRLYCTAGTYAWYIETNQGPIILEESAPPPS